MIVEHVLPAGWADTEEQDKIQPSAVAGMAHTVSLSPEDIELLRGPQGQQGPQGLPGADGAKGQQGPQGLQGIRGPEGPATQSILPAGMIATFRRKTAPGGWLAMVGVGVLVANYPELLAACYVGDAGNETEEGFYRCDNQDGTGRNTAGAYLFVEDMRGQFIRGWTPGGSRKLGAAQGDAIRNITGSFIPHGAGISTMIAGASGALKAGVERNVYSAHNVTNGAYSYDGVNFDASVVVPTADENRPKNRAYLVCVSTGKAA